MDDSVKQLLIDTINKQFTADSQRGRTRKIIFWYDGKQEYSDSIDELEPLLKENNTILIKYDNNSFWIRDYIEHEETEKNIVIYFNFDRPKGLENNLLDIESYNKDFIFNPDMTSMRLAELELPEECREIIKKYAKFFKNKKREEEFKNFEVENKDNSNIDYIVTAVLLESKSINEEDLLKEFIKMYFDDDKKFNEFKKYADNNFIYDMIYRNFGYKIDNYDKLPELLKSLVFTYFASNISNKEKYLNKYGKFLLRAKIQNVCVFVDNLMRDTSTNKYFEKISKKVEKEFGIPELLDSMDIDDYINSDAFESIDIEVLKYIADKIKSDVGEYDYYLNFINIRESKYWNYKYHNEYEFLKVAIHFNQELNKLLPTIKVVGFDEFANNYTENLYLIDTLYRKLYFYFNKIEDKDIFMPVRDNIEGKYVNKFISELSIKWSSMIETIKDNYSSNRMRLQNRFYKNYIYPFKDKKDRTIVIISDAFRYECAKELSDKLKEISKTTKIECMQGLVPSYTKLGMAALLPNTKLSRALADPKNTDILVDGKKSSSTKDREVILQDENPDSIAIQYDEFIDKPKIEWKKLFTGKKVIYIYHNRVDKTGEHNENDIFEACEKSIDELYDLVKALHKTFSGVNVFITADHGFFFKQGKIESYDKVQKNPNSEGTKDRFEYSDKPVDREGILSIKLDYIFGENGGYANTPKGIIKYAKQGSDDRYAHGGIMPQEILIPVIDFKSSRSSEESSKVGITYSGISKKITNSITYLEFLQDNNVDSTHKPCRYLIHFEDEDGNRVSDECTIIANYENTEVKDRSFKEKFVFKNTKYDRLKPYYLIITDEETGIEFSRTQFFIDIAITNNFDF